MYTLGKRAVSPLIATVLLIAFAVALGAVVMSWGRSYVEDQIDISSGSSAVQFICSQDVKIEVSKIRGEPQLCYDSTSGRIDAILQNTGNYDVDNIQLGVIGNDVSTNNSILSSKLKKGDPVKVSALYAVNGITSADIGQIKQVKLTPKIRTASGEQYCTDAALTFDYVNTCI